MTRRRLRIWVVLTITYFVVLLITSSLTQSRAHDVYLFIKDMLGALIAIPAAWLANCFQRRASFLDQLRRLWSKTVEAVQGALAYTYEAEPTHDRLGATLLPLSVAIDEYRAAFRGADAGKPGRFPYESLMEIHRLVADLGWGPRARDADRQRIRAEITARWRGLRDLLLKEFDREVPTYFEPGVGGGEG